MREGGREGGIRERERGMREREREGSERREGNTHMPS